MFDALQQRLQELQELPMRLDDAAIAVATEQRGKVKARKRAAGARRKALRAILRGGKHWTGTRAERLTALAVARGVSEAHIRNQLRKGRKGSGISIEARAEDGAVVLTASNQVNHFRRANNETDDLTAVFARQIMVIAGFRARRGY